MAALCQHKPSPAMPTLTVAYHKDEQEPTDRQIGCSILSATPVAQLNDLVGYIIHSDVG